MLPDNFLIIDKPKGWTSHDVVAKLRGILKEKKIGHLGTLDPLATGVLVVAVGRDATKKIVQYMELDKEYEVELELGKSSNTYDAEGEITEHLVDWTQITPEKIQNTLSKFWGETEQMPPAFSAKKIGGVPAYRLARKGKEVHLRTKKVFMQGEEIQVDLPFVRFKVTVSSGTYIRSLVHDFGQSLGTGAILTNLRRTRVGDFTLQEAQKIEQVSA